MKLGMVIDASRCIGCMACMVSCTTANDVPEGLHRNWVRVRQPDVAAARPGGQFQPGACMHCEHPTCVAVCPTGATWRNGKTGEVVLDRALCIGCGSCVRACPYDARYLHPVKRVADKCDFCASRRAQGLEPACIGTCPTRARAFGDLDDPSSTVAQLMKKMDVVRLEYPGVHTKPSLVYRKGVSPDNWMRSPETTPSAAALLHWIAPAVKTLAGLTGAGLVAALVRQIVLPDSPPSDPGKTGKQQPGTHPAPEKHEGGDHV